MENEKSFSRRKNILITVAISKIIFQFFKPKQQVVRELGKL